ncbi:MAG TPA: PsiF family protein [Moraxellaceae bacterium]
MKTMLAVVILLMGTGMAYGNEDNREDCNRKAEGTSGSERNRIISACIRRNARANNMPPMLGKMTECNRKAGDMTGDARISFVDKCLKEP